MYSFLRSCVGLGVIVLMGLVMVIALPIGLVVSPVLLLVGMSMKKVAKE